MALILRRRLGRDFTVTHAREAFHLLRYQNARSGRTEWLWNSRDGATPPAIVDHLADPEVIEAYAAALEKAEPAEVKRLGNSPAIMQHVAWHEDSFVPNFVPPLGMRIFVSWERAPTVYRASAIDNQMAAFRALSAEAAALSDADARRAIADSIPAGDPCVVFVDQAMLEFFHDQARDNPIMPPPSDPVSGKGLIIPH